MAPETFFFFFGCLYCFLEMKIFNLNWEIVVLVYYFFDGKFKIQSFRFFVAKSSIVLLNMLISLNIILRKIQHRCRLQGRRKRRDR